MRRTLSCVTARPILYQHVVKWLVSSTGQLVNPHGVDPLLAHGAFRIPAVNHTVIPRPGRISVNSVLQSEVICLFVCVVFYRNLPLVFHNKADWILDLQVFGSAAPLHLRSDRMLLVLDVLQCVLHQVAHSSMLRRIQSLDMLQDVQHLGARRRKIREEQHNAKY